MRKAARRVLTALAVLGALLFPLALGLQARADAAADFAPVPGVRVTFVGPTVVKVENERGVDLTRYLYAVRFFPTTSKAGAYSEVVLRRPGTKGYLVLPIASLEYIPRND